MDFAATLQHAESACLDAAPFFLFDKNSRRSQSDLRPIRPRARDSARARLRARLMRRARAVTPGRAGVRAARARRRALARAAARAAARARRGGLRAPGFEALLPPDHDRA